MRFRSKMPQDTLALAAIWSERFTCLAASQEVSSAGTDGVRIQHQD